MAAWLAVIALQLLLPALVASPDVSPSAAQTTAQGDDSQPVVTSPPPLRVVGSGSGLYAGSTWIWSPENVSRANSKHAIFDEWGTACTWAHNHSVIAHFEIGGWWQCGGPWNCSAGDTACNTKVAPPGIAEWGFDYHNLGPTFPACFEVVPMSGGQPVLPCCNFSSAAHAKKPASTPAEAAEHLKTYFQCIHSAAADRPTGAIAPTGFDALSGHYFYWAHAVDFASATARPVSRILSELCENINSINGHMAWTRGLARQYGLPWGVDVSTWYGGVVPDFGAKIHPWAGTAGAAGGAGGHSESLLRRTYFAVAAAGASLIYQESADDYVFLPTTDPTDGVFELSPLGKMDQEFTHIARGDTARGEPLTPVAVLMEQNHGMGLGWWYQSRAWETMASGGFPLTPQQQVATLLMETLWPGSWRVQWDSSMNGIPKEFAPTPEGTYMVASPFGDLIDILAPKNLSTAFLLANYKVLVLAGDVEVDTLLPSTVLSSYIEGGGTLVLTSDLLTTSPSLSKWVAERTGIEVAAASKKVTRSVTAAHGGSGTARWRVASHDVTATPPVCAPIFGASGVVWTGRFYIKTGGDRSKLRGFDRGVFDKCCHNTTTSTCWEFESLAACSLALKTAATGCASCAHDWRHQFCPMWSDGASVAVTPLMQPPGQHVQVLAEFTTTTVARYPAVVSASAAHAGPSAVTAGRVVVSLVNDAPTLQAFKLLEGAMLAPLIGQLAPFELLLSNGSDARPLVQMMINRVGSTGLNVTLINNLGVTKGPKTAAVVDPSANIVVQLRLKQGHILQAFSTRLPVKQLAVQPKNTVMVAIPAGDVALVSITLSSGSLKTDDASAQRPRLADLVPHHCHKQGDQWTSSGNNVSKNFLKHALPLPKMHFSWAFPPGQFASASAVESLLVDYARVAGAVPLGAHADWGGGASCGAAQHKPPCANRKARTAMAVEACHKASLVPPPLGRPKDSPPCINLNFSPWYGPGRSATRNASDTDGEQAELEEWRLSLTEVKGWIDQENKNLGSKVSVCAVCMDSEQYNWSPAVQPPVDGSSTRAAVRRKNELIYNVSRAVFPDKAVTTIIFYDYGAAHFYPRSPRKDWTTVTAPGKVGPSWQDPGNNYHAPQGWVSGAGHGTFTESFAQEIPFSTSLYEIHQSALSRTKFTVVAESARAQHGGGSGASSGATVIPYLSLGAGFRPNTTLVLGGGGDGGGPLLSPIFPEVGNGERKPFNTRRLVFPQ